MTKELIFELSRKTILASRNLIILIYLSVFLVGCGKEEVEGDKHPDVPQFPEHTNQKIEIKPFLELYDLKANKNYFYGFNASKYDKNRSLAIFDKNFKLLHKVNNVVPYLSDSGETFSLFPLKSLLEKEVFQYKAPLFKKQKIQYIKPWDEITSPTKPQLIKIHQSKLDAEINNPEFDQSEYITQLYLKGISKRNDKILVHLTQLAENATCITPIGSFIYIFSYPDKNIAVQMIDYTDEEGIKDKMCNDFDRLSDNYKKVDSFDKTVMGNNWSGNHFVGGYSSYGFNYINLTINNETTQTKVTNSRGDDGLSIILNSNKRLILKQDSELFVVTKK